ncbi:hypothetical protein GGR51DRAFT_508443 [Nemania sp. FL0031]|nr:hypothetical protein GGR51DRAFT_508443 [Nemania sp. FL0031]
MASISELPSEAAAALKEVGDWLKDQPFTEFSGLRFFSGPGLVERCNPILKYLPDKCKEDFDPQKHDTRVTSIHVHTHMTVPVKDGSNGLLIPVHIINGAALDGQRLHPLQYVELGRSAEAMPEFYALLLLSRTIE